MTSYIMVLIGCAQGGSQCEPIITLPVAYRSESVCLDARADIVAASSGLGYGRVVAECRAMTGGSQRKVEVKPTPTA